MRTTRITNLGIKHLKNYIDRIMQKLRQLGYPDPEYFIDGIMDEIDLRLTYEENKENINDSLKSMNINPDCIEEVALGFAPEVRAFWLEGAPFPRPELSEVDELNFMFTMNALNFCYWGDPKWTVDYNGERLDGAWAMIASLHRALEEGKPVFNASYLENITRQEVAEILKGEPQIPLFQERVRILREIGEGLNKQYQGQFVNLLEDASQDVLTLLDLVTRGFPSYYDSANYEGQEVVFHKRAQLAISGLHGTFKGQGFGKFRNIHELTICADYKIPQVLRKLGILQYSPDLEDKVDTKTELPAGSQEEVEIRSSQVVAVEYLKDALKPKIPEIKVVDLDSWLWLKGQEEKSPTDKPYHRTRTIFY